MNECLAHKKGAGEYRAVAFEYLISFYCIKNKLIFDDIWLPTTTAYDSTRIFLE